MVPTPEGSKSASGVRYTRQSAEAPVYPDCPECALALELTEPDKRASVVEVHPAVAIWLWYRAAKRTPAAWTYKGIKVEKLQNESIAEYRLSVCAKSRENC